MSSPISGDENTLLASPSSYLLHIHPLPPAFVNQTPVHVNFEPDFGTVRSNQSGLQAVETF